MADALTAPRRRQHESLELAPHVIGLAVGEDEGDAPSRLEASIRSNAREQQALRPRRSAGDQPLTRNVSVRLCLTQAPFRAPGR
jgi:hypothetical protein